MVSDTTTTIKWGIMATGWIAESTSVSTAVHLRSCCPSVKRASERGKTRNLTL